MSVCLACGENLINVWGKPKSRILLVSEAPTDEDLVTRLPFSAEKGEVLKAELRRVGLDYAACRATLLWRHPIPKGKGMAEIKSQCFDAMLGDLLLQLASASCVLFMGAELSKLIFNHPVTKINGARMTGPLLPRNVQVAIASFSPGLALAEGHGIGDFRFAIEQFGSYAKPIYKEMLNAR